MPDPAWWGLHGVQVLVLTGAMVFALRASRNVGAHTLYANLLFLLGLAFWAFLMSEAAFLGRHIIGRWYGPGAFNDVLALLGWALVIVSIGLFVERFGRREHAPWRRWGVLITQVLVPVLVIMALLQVWVSPPGADPDRWVRIPYLVADGAALGLVIGGLDRFLRLRKSALGQLYLFLGLAIIAKTGSDLAWAYLAARDSASIYATALSPIAGVLAATGLGLHLRAMRREPLSDAVPTPWLRPEQMELMALAHHVGHAAGGYAANLVTHAAGSVFDEAQRPWRAEGLTVVAEADGTLWSSALERAKETAVAAFGNAGSAAVDAAEALTTDRREHRSLARVTA